MENDTENYDDNYSQDDDSPDIEDLESRIEELESNQQDIANSIPSNKYSGCATIIYIPGLVLAMILSYTANQSILWAILHGYSSWLYVIYKLFF